MFDTTYLNSSNNFTADCKYFIRIKLPHNEKMRFFFLGNVLKLTQVELFLFFYFKNVQCLVFVSTPTPNRSAALGQQNHLMLTLGLDIVTKHIPSKSYLKTQNNVTATLKLDHKGPITSSSHSFIALHIFIASSCRTMK